MKMFKVKTRLMWPHKVFLFSVFLSIPILMGLGMHRITLLAQEMSPQSTVLALWVFGVWGCTGLLTGMLSVSKINPTAKETFRLSSLLIAVLGISGVLVSAGWDIYRFSHDSTPSVQVSQP